jgi:hypothetical protein
MEKTITDAEDWLNEREEGLLPILLTFQMKDIDVFPKNMFGDMVMEKLSDDSRAGSVLIHYFILVLGIFLQKLPVHNRVRVGVHDRCDIEGNGWLSLLAHYEGVSCTSTLSTMGSKY